MPDLLALGTVLQSDVSVPSTTPGQQFLAITVTVLLVLGAIIAYRRSQVWGLAAEHRDVREDVRAQRRRQTPAELKLTPETLADLPKHELRGRVDDLFDAEARETVTRFPGALLRIYRAVSVAWRDRVDWLPNLARKAFGLAVAVVVFGAVAVSSDAVIRLLQTDPTAPPPGSLVTVLTGAGHTGVDVVGLYPFAGQLWQLTFAGAVLAAQWLYHQWVLIAAALIAIGVSVIVLDAWVRDREVPDRVIHDRRRAIGTALVSVASVWVAGVAPVLVSQEFTSPVWSGLAVAPLWVAFLAAGIAMLLGSGAVYRLTQGLGAAFAMSSIADDGWAPVLGIWLSVLTVGLVVGAVGPRAVDRIRANIRAVAGARARPVAALVVLQRALGVLSVVAGVLAVSYAVVGVSGGAWGAVLEAAATAPPETQALLGVTVVAVGALLAYAVVDSWGDVSREVRAAMAQQAIRAQLLRRGVPWLGVFFAYALLSIILGSIPLAFAGAIVAGVVLRTGVRLADEAEYRADIRGMLEGERKPIIVAIRAMRVDVDGREAYYVDCNGEQFLDVNRSAVVDDVAAHALAAACGDTPPAADSRKFADYVFRIGIGDPGNWDEKLDEQIRKAALKPFRPSPVPVIGSRSRRVRRATFDEALSEFEEARVQRRLREADLARCLDRGERSVVLERHPFTVDSDAGAWSRLSG
ncbi:hypothetical protein [Halobaculum magnesiiphilum]|uniref:Uncharacterized protein n=1 Tax=Halobaculum magnesiiphilum TaxID=1017351 RepID=A0A8T8WB83_9EURY|nr:hypothetical protein [Halobaculum magnesiiphilum]QZP37086.1 hypothetical protein K6T50_12410 [Halobaculum magnesiiphilum]